MYCCYVVVYTRFINLIEKIIKRRDFSASMRSRDFEIIKIILVAKQFYFFWSRKIFIKFIKTEALVCGNNL